MLTRTNRSSAARIHLWRRPHPLSARTLEMMVMSGVVRRAEVNPPIVPYGTGHEPPGNPHGASPQESASAQGWLSRLILGRRPPGPSQTEPNPR